MPIQIKLNYMGQLRAVFGVSQENYDCAEGLTALQVYQDRVKKLSTPAAIQLLDPQGNPGPHVLLFINDEQMEWSEPKILQQGDDLTLLAPLAGG